MSAAWRVRGKVADRIDSEGDLVADVCAWKPGKWGWRAFGGPKKALSRSGVAPSRKAAIEAADAALSRSWVERDVAPASPDPPSFREKIAAAVARLTPPYDAALAANPGDLALEAVATEMVLLTVIARAVAREVAGKSRGEASDRAAVTVSLFHKLLTRALEAERAAGVKSAR